MGSFIPHFTMDVITISMPGLKLIRINLLYLLGHSMIYQLLHLLREAWCQKRLSFVLPITTYLYYKQYKFWVSLKI